LNHLRGMNTTTHTNTLTLHVPKTTHTFWGVFFVVGGWFGSRIRVCSLAHTERINNNNQEGSTTMKTTLHK